MSLKRWPDGSTSAPKLTIIASARTGYPTLESFLEGVREQHLLKELRLVPLDRAETGELIALRLDCRVEDLSGELILRIHELCGGNPFFELADAPDAGKP